MPFTKDIFDSNPELGRLFAIDYASRKVLIESENTPTLEYFKILLSEKLHDMLHERVSEYLINGATQEDAEFEIGRDVERMLGITIFNVNFANIIEAILDSPQYFILNDRIEYNIQQELKKTSSEKIDYKKTEKEINVINNMVTVAKQENFKSFLELLSEQNVGNGKKLIRG